MPSKLLTTNRPLEFCIIFYVKWVIILQKKDSFRYILVSCFRYKLTYEESLLRPIIAIDYLKLIGINLIEILNHVKKKLIIFIV